MPNLDDLLEPNQRTAGTGASARPTGGGGIAQAAQQATMGASTGPSVKVDSAGNAQAPGAPRTTLPATVNPSSTGSLVPQGEGARAPVRPGAPSVIDVTPSARRPPVANPTLPTMTGNANAEVARDTSMRSQIQLDEYKQQQSRAAAANRINSNPVNAGPPNPNAATMRQQLGLSPTPPGAGAAGAGAAAAGAAGAGTAGTAAAEAGPGANASRLARAAYNVGEFAGKNRAVLGRGLGAAAGGYVISHFNDYKLNEPDVDSSATGTMKALGHGDFAAVGKSALKGLKETAMDVGSAAANLADYVIPGKAPVSTEYYKMLKEKFGDKLIAHPSVIAQAAAAAPAPAAKPAPAAAPAAEAKPAPAATKPAVAQPAAKPAAPLPPHPLDVAEDQRDAALAAIEQEGSKDPRAALYQTIDHRTGVTTYQTADGGQITVRTPNPEDSKLMERISVIDGRPDAGPTFEHEGKVYKNVVVGKDQLGFPITRAVSVDGKVNNSTQVDDASLVRQYDEAKSRMAGVSEEDQARIDAYNDRQKRIQAAHGAYDEAVAKFDASEQAPAGSPVAKAARAAYTPNKKFEAALSAEGADGDFADFARSLIQQESASGKNTKTSNRGATGPMQVRPGTFGDMADKGWDIKNEDHNMRAGIRYAKMMWDKAGGDPALAAAGYYGGPGGQAKARAGVAVRDPKNPNAPDTLQYGQEVAGRMGQANVQQVPKTTVTSSDVQSAPAVVAAPDGAAAAQGAPAKYAPRRVRDPLAGAVHVIDMASDGPGVMHLPGGWDDVRQGLTMDGYQTIRSALEKNPELARRVQVSNAGVTYDGMRLPSNVLAGGEGAMTEYAKNANQAQLYGMNPTAADMAKQQQKGELDNKGHEINAGATKYTADQKLKGDLAQAANDRYLKLKGEVNGKTATQEGDKVFDKQKGEMVPSTPGAAAGAAHDGPPNIAKQQWDAAKKAFMAAPDTPEERAKFDAVFGPGWAKKVREGK
jgi:hypothetical protein